MSPRPADDNHEVRFSRRSERLYRALPFLAIGTVAQLSAAWPPGPVHPADFWLSTALFVVAGILMVLPHGLLPATVVLPNCIYVASVAFLMLATGGVGSGIGSLLLIPIVGAALYGHRWESAIVVMFVVGALFGVSIASPEMVAATARRLVLFGSMGAVISTSIHVLRERLMASHRRTSRLLDQAETINTAARQLASLLEPSSITALGTELAARIASPPAPEPRSALYFRIDDGVAFIDGQCGETGTNVEQGWPLDEHPALKQAVQTGNPVLAPLVLNGVDPSLDAVRTGNHGAWVPVRPDGVLHGVLAIISRGFPVTDESLDRCVALGHLMELALSNWFAHQRLAQQATVEERRRIARELHDGLAHELAFIASKAHRPGGRTVTAVDAGELANAADRALDEARRAISILSTSHPETVDRSITQTAEDLGARHGIGVRLDLATGVDLPGEVTEHLLRILREAVTNAATHGNPNQVTVRLLRDDGVRLVIEDDGRGFETGTLTMSSGFGLISMEERARLIGARYQLESSPAHGTRIEVAIP